MYSIKKFDFDEIDAIKDIWCQLEKGADMTYFQNLEWYKNFIEYIPLNKSIDCGFWIVYNNHTPVLIAPLWILKRRYKLVNKKCIRIIPNWGFTDYINFIYSDFDPEACRFLFNAIRKDYGCMNWIFSDIKENSSLCQFIASEFKDNCQIGDSMPCPALSLPNDENAYFSSLSKSVRQNIRTACNRAEKDGVAFAVNFDDDCREECSELRNRRNSIRKDNVENSQSSFIQRIKNWIAKTVLGRNWIRFNSFVPITGDKNSHLMTMRDEKSGELVSFFNYGYDNCHHEIVVMAAGFNPDYIRYSPGLILMYKFICHTIKEGDIKRIDFTRGDEPYKLQLGAKIENNKRLILQF